MIVLNAAKGRTALRIEPGTPPGAKEAELDSGQRTNDGVSLRSPYMR